jgi:hypothetical protein
MQGKAKTNRQLLFHIEESAVRLLHYTRMIRQTANVVLPPTCISILVDAFGKDFNVLCSEPRISVCKVLSNPFIGPNREFGGFEHWFCSELIKGFLIEAHSGRKLVIRSLIHNIV